MAAAPVKAACVLVAPERQHSRPHFHRVAIHGFHRPAPLQGDDPLRSGVFMPIPLPAWRQLQKQDLELALLAGLNPQRCRTGAELLHGKTAHHTLALVADALVIAPNVPVRHHRRITCWMGGSHCHGCHVR
jgi:hypothetical protein